MDGLGWHGVFLLVFLWGVMESEDELPERLEANAVSLTLEGNWNSVFARPKIGDDPSFLEGFPS